MTAAIHLAPDSSAFLFRLLADGACAVTLAYLLYYWRYRRDDLAFVYVAVNLGVFAALAVISGGGITAAVGFGLFGILSIIRLRSEAFDSVEIGYFFLSLVLALVNGLAEKVWIAGVLDVVLLGTVLVGDLGRARLHARSQLVTLDRVFREEAALKNHLEELLGAQVVAVTPVMSDFVRDISSVSVRYRWKTEPSHD